MNLDITQINIIGPVYYVINLHDEQCVKISDIFSNLEEAKGAYSIIVKDHPFARLGGCADKNQ